MPNRVQRLKQLVKRYEQRAKKQVSALGDKATQAAMTIPIGPKPKRQLLQAVRRLRKVLNTQLTKVEKAIMAAGKRQR
jgi:hypothetical protein